MGYKYKTTFTALAKAVPPTEDIKKEAFASLKDLSKLLPTDINPEDEKDLLYVCANLVAFPCANANGDAIDRPTALKNFKGFEKKFFDVEHNRNVVVGNICTAGFTSFEDNTVVDENTVFNSDQLYNIAVTGYIWKVIAGKLADFLIQASNENNREYGAVSLSFEVGFDDYDIMVGSKILKDATMITDPLEKEKYEKYLQANGGSGTDEDGNYVYRVLKDWVPLGAGLVTRPASQVKGIFTVEAQKIDNKFTLDKTKSEKSDKNGVTTIKSSVINNIEKNMSIEIKDLTDLETYKSELFKEEATAGRVTRFIAEKLTKASEEYAKQLKDKEDVGKRLTEAKLSAEARANDLEKKINELTSEYNKLSEETSKQHKKVRLENRMAALDKSYDLEDAAKQSIADDVGDMDDDQYSCYMKKMEPFLKEKSKDKKEVDSMKIKDALKLLGVDTDKLSNQDDLDKEIKAVFASIKETKQTALPNDPPLEDKTTLKEKMQKAFGKSVKLNNKELTSKK